MRIFLIGFMGCGKSYWAKKWGKEFEIQVVDLDSFIESEEQNSIENIFNIFGEEYFRIIEREALHKTLDIENCIVACGGGTPAYFDNLNWMKENGLVVYLYAENGFLLKNILGDIKCRPLLKNTEIDKFIEMKLRERSIFYESASLKLNSEDLNLQSFQKILNYA